MYTYHNPNSNYINSIDANLTSTAKVALYDLFADLCAFIIRTKPHNYLVRYSCVSSEEQARINKLILASTTLSKDKKGAFKPISNSDITDKFIDNLLTFSKRIKTNADLNLAMRFLQALDESMSEIMQEEIAHLQQMEHTSALNRNSEYTGIELLPRCGCVWARKSRQSYSYRRLDNYLNHIMVIEKSSINENIDDHVFLPKGFFKDFDATKILKVAACPLTNKSNFDTKLHTKNDMQVFSLDYHAASMAKHNTLVWNKILTAGREGAEIIVFPEMLGNSTMVSFIQESLRSLSDEEYNDIPAMIILPSFFDNGENYCVVLDKYGNEIGRQYKQNPYIMKNKHGEFMEDILGSSNQIVIFHYEGIGRFAILICKDFLTTRYMERIMRGFMLTMIIVPAYSTGSYDFKMSFDLCAHDYCNVVWINSCAAMVPGKESNFEYIGYVRKRIGRHDDESKALYRMPPCDKLMSGKCDQKCIYFDDFGAV